MKKHVFGRKFKRDANERKALFKNLLTSLVLEERIKTTEAKAKAIKGAADKLITKAKKEGVNVYKSLHPDINQEAVLKLMSEIAPRFAGRQGGYTRIIKVGKRRVADNAEMVYLEWTERSSEVRVKNSELPKKAKKNKPASSKKATEKVKKVTKIEAPAPNAVIAKPVIGKKVEEKVQKQGIFKRLVTRQKKGQ